MKRLMVVLVVLVVAVLFGSRAARADEPEETVGRVFVGGSVLAIAGTIVAQGVTLWNDHELARQGRPPSLRRSARELALNHLALTVGTTLLVFGLDQHADGFSALGGVLMATSVPGTLHGMSGLGGGGDGATDAERRADRHAAGVTEVAFGLPELAIEGLAFSAAAADPVDHVRGAGMTAAAVLAIPSAVLAIHGIYTLATPDRIAHAPSPPVWITPTIVGAANDPTLGIGAAGRF